MPEMSALERVNLRRQMHIIASQIGDLSSGMTANSAKKRDIGTTIDEYLRQMRDSHQIADFSTEYFAFSSSRIIRKKFPTVEVTYASPNDNKLVYFAKMRNPSLRRIKKWMRKFSDIDRVDITLTPVHAAATISMDCAIWSKE